MGRAGRTQDSSVSRRFDGQSERSTSHGLFGDVEFEFGLERRADEHNDHADAVVGDHAERFSHRSIVSIPTIVVVAELVVTIDERFVANVSAVEQHDDEFVDDDSRLDQQSIDDGESQRTELVQFVDGERVEHAIRRLGRMFGRIVRL